MRAPSSRATALATLVIMTMRSLLPACVQATPEAKKKRPPHVPLSSHRLRIGRVLGAGFDRRLLALRQVRSRRLRPAGRLTCRVHRRKCKKQGCCTERTQGCMSGGDLATSRPHPDLYIRHTFSTVLISTVQYRWHDKRENTYAEESRLTVPTRVRSPQRENYLESCPPRLV